MRLPPTLTLIPHPARLGRDRDSSAARGYMLCVFTDSAARKPEKLSFVEASAAGVTFVTGWLGAVEVAQLAVLLPRSATPGAPA